MRTLASNNEAGCFRGRGDSEVCVSASPRHPNATFRSLKAWNLLLPAVPFLRNTGNTSPRRFPNLTGSAGSGSHRPWVPHTPFPPISRPLILSTWWQFTAWTSSSPLGHLPAQSQATYLVYRGSSPWPAEGPRCSPPGSCTQLISPKAGWVAGVASLVRGRLESRPERYKKCRRSADISDFGAPPRAQGPVAPPPAATLWPTGDTPPSESLRVRAAARPVSGQLIRVTTHGHHHHPGPGLLGANKGWGICTRGQQSETFKFTQKESRSTSNISLRFPAPQIFLCFKEAAQPK